MLSHSMTENQPLISVITATYDAVEHLPKLIESLQLQTDKDFEWVVADGASSDGTFELLQNASGINIILDSQADFGIYDALNRAIKIASGKYYIFCGADDFFYKDAIANFRKAIEQSGADIVVANAVYGDRQLQPKNAAPWLWGHFAYISAHTLATAFRKDLHARYGYYSRKFPIAADQLFVLNACQNGASRYIAHFEAGEVGRDGVSSIDGVGSATEVFRVQLSLGRSKITQMFLLMLRLLKSL